MTTDDTIIKCGKCKVVLKESSDIQPAQRLPCPECGSTSRAFEITMYASIDIKVKERIKGKHAGEKEHFIIEVSGDDLFRDMGMWVKLSRAIDRDHDSYYEVIIDPETGQIIRKCIEPLSEHTGHGSAKYKKAKP